jgi:hypothetical protein
VTVFPDAQLATLEIVRAALADTAYGTLAPEDFPQGSAPTLPYAQVRTDSTRVRHPITATASMRVVVYAASQAAAVALAWRLHAILREYGGGDKVRGFTDQTGPVPARDPVTGDPICSFTVAASLRPVTT